MSVLAVNAVTDANGGNTATINSMTPTADSLQGFRNRIINGDMRIDQRNAGAAVTTDGSFPIDRWKYEQSQTSKLSLARSTTVPSGFTNSVSVTVTTAYTPTTDNYFVLTQSIEGLNVSDLGWGTASAKTITLSFWVRSSVTGTYSFGLANSAYNRSYVSTYAISAANTWEYKTITIAGDTTGTWLTDTGIGLRVRFNLGSGPDRDATANVWGTGADWGVSGDVDLVANSGATWFITGVQLEVGSVATPFERRPYGTELALCQRYCQMIKGSGSFTKYGLGVCTSTTNLRGVVHLPVSMRTAPSLTTTSTASNYGVYTSSDIACSAVPTLNAQGTEVLANIDFTVASGLTTGNAALMQANNNTSAYLLLTAEL
jgi:hypothetical protein